MTLPRFSTMSDILASISSLSEAITTTAQKWTFFIFLSGTKRELARDVRVLERELIAHTAYHDRATLDKIHSLFETCLELVSYPLLTETVLGHRDADESLRYWTLLIRKNPNGCLNDDLTPFP